MPKEYWVTREGRRILISDMTNGHVQNTYNMLIRSARTRAQLAALDALRYAANAPDGAAMAAERAADEMLDMDDVELVELFSEESKFLKRMYLEVTTRGLNTYPYYPRRK